MKKPRKTGAFSISIKKNLSKFNTNLFAKFYYFTSG
jgi:hypothetical protein